MTIKKIMTYEEISQLQELYANCELCHLAENRISKEERIALGQGRIDAKALLIVPSPVFEKSQYPAAYSSASEEYKILTQIFTKVGLELDDWYITSTVMCKGNADRESVLKCNERLKRLLYVISPEVVVLSSKQACYAFFGNANMNHGVCESQHYKTYHAHDITDYLLKKSTKSDNWTTMAAELMSQWKEIKNLMN
jgi:uracil-DNA glycosylase family 4